MNDKVVCRRVIRKLNAFLDDELSSEDKKLLATHLLSCKSCRLEYNTLKKINEELQYLQDEKHFPLSLKMKLLDIPTKEKQKPSRKNIVRRYASLPAAAMILLTLFSALLLGKIYLDNTNESLTDYQNYQIAQESFYNLWEEIAYE